MRYVFTGRLCGYICPDCPEALSEVTVRLYRSREAQDVTALAAARPVETLAILGEAEVEEKSSSLLAETQTDADGRFSFELGEKQKYEGGAFELDVFCTTVPHRKESRREPKSLQFSVTTLHPSWRGAAEQEESRWAWEYCIPNRFWCAVRGRFGAWTICGKVSDCASGVPVSGVLVHAFDADWIQPDELGSALTDAAGKFRIDYLRSDFEKTPLSPLINFELVGGPDLYFTAESGTTTVLNEPSSRGRQPDRENAGPCSCVELCIEAPTPPYDNPWFTHIGDFHIYADIDAGSGAINTAFAGHAGPGWGFFSGMKLKGFCPKTSPVGSPDPMRYRFLYEHPSNPGAHVPITGDPLVVPVVVGSKLIQWKVSSDSFEWTFQSIVVAGSGATPDPTPQPGGPGPWGAPPSLVLVPDAEGWVNVHPDALDDGFYGPLIRFNSPAAAPGGAAPDDGAGNPVSDPKSGVALKLIFEAGPVGGAATFTNEVDKVLVNNWSEVRQLDLLQFGGPGGNPCTPLSTDLDVQYTVDHELISHDWWLSIESASGSAPGTVIPPYPGGTTARGHAGTRHENIAAWTSCSYQVWLWTRRALTDGETDDDWGFALKTFCK